MPHSAHAVTCTHSAHAVTYALYTRSHMYALYTRSHIRTLHTQSHVRTLHTQSHRHSAHIMQPVTSIVHYIYAFCHIYSLSHTQFVTLYAVCHIPCLSHTQSVTYPVCHHALLVEENVNNPKKVILITLRVRCLYHAHINCGLTEEHLVYSYCSN